MREVALPIIFLYLFDPQARQSTCDEIEEILAWLGPLHDDDEAVGPLEVVDEADDAADASEAGQQANLQRHALTVHL